jgi:asparagine synthase (glutamine-hydrolysing)
MCGIAGGIAVRPDARPDPERVRAMSCRIAHRGPDGEGVWTAPSGRAVLAHRRLSIIDLVTGQQPMVQDDGAAGLVFNGEIYNYRELRAQLERANIPLRTASDTEVLLQLLARGGTRALDVLRGMFAFAHWDDARGTLLVARDRVGKKPLYWVVEDGCLYFASSLKALRETATGTWRIDPRALDLYLSLGYVPAPGTIYEGVHKLEAGTWATLEGDRLAARRYWDLAPAPTPFAGTFSEAVDRLEEILTEAVDIRLRSDVPLGIFLSGGIDSSLVTALAMKRAQTPIETFSIGFDDAGFDESGYASQVARHLGTRHHLFRVRLELLDLMPKVVWHFGEPYADSSALPTWVLAERTRAHVTVALGGDGGDEGFGGYDWYRTAARLGQLASRVPPVAAAAGARALALYPDTGAPGARRMGQLRRGLGMLAVRDAGARFAALRTFVGAAEARGLYMGALAEARREGDAARALIAGAYASCAGTPLRRMRWADMRTYLADDLLPKVDVASMAHGVEARAPLLDQEVVRFAMSLPDAYLTDERGGKRVLRALLHRYVPANLFERPKQGFSVPLLRWFAGPVRGRLDALARSERLQSLGWIRPEGVERLTREHAEGLRDNSHRLFALLVLDEWLEHA